MKESLDQRRARFAWEKVQELKGNKEYANLAKGAPALIIQGGLMPVLAFYNDKAKDHHKALRDHLCEWLHRQFNDRIGDKKFSTVMSALMGRDGDNAAEHALFYRLATEEALAVLRWIRQFAAAVTAK